MKYLHANPNSGIQGIHQNPLPVSFTVADSLDLLILGSLVLTLFAGAVLAVIFVISSTQSQVPADSPQIRQTETQPIQYQPAYGRPVYESSYDALYEPRRIVHYVHQ